MAQATARFRFPTAGLLWHFSCLRARECIPAARSARAVVSHCPSRRIEGAGNAGCALHPRSRVRYAQARSCTRAYRAAVNTPTSPAQWLYGLYVISPVRALCCHRHPWEVKASHELDACIAASGPHDFAVRACPVVCRTSASIAIPALRNVAIAKRPSGGPGCAVPAPDLPDVTTGIFLIWGIDMISDNQNSFAPAMQRASTAVKPGAKRPGHRPAPPTARPC